MLTFADAVKPLPYKQVSRTLTFNSSGQVIGPYGLTNQGQQPSWELDHNRIYEVKLNRLFIKNCSAPTNTLKVAFGLRGQNMLPDALGYGPGTSTEELVILYDSAVTTDHVLELRNTVLASDIDGRIKFGFGPKVILKDADSGDALTFDEITVQLDVLVHAQSSLSKRQVV